MGMGPPPTSSPGRPRRPSWQASHSAPYDKIPYDTYNAYNAPGQAQSNPIPLQTGPATHPNSRPITNTNTTTHNPRHSAGLPIPVSSEFSSLPEVVPLPSHSNSTALLSPTDPSQHPVSPLSAWGSPLPPSASPYTSTATTSLPPVSPNTTGASTNTTGRTRPPRRPAAFSPDSYDALNPNHTAQVTTGRPPRSSSSPNTAAYINDEAPASPPPQPPSASLATTTPASPPFSPPASAAFPSQPEQQGGYVRPPIGAGPGLAMGMGMGIGGVGGGSGGRYGKLKPVGQHGELLDRKRRRRRRICLLVWGSVGIVLLVIALIVGVVVGVLKGRNGGK